MESYLPDTLPELIWTMYPDLCDSDHFPILLLSSLISPQIQTSPLDGSSTKPVGPFTKTPPPTSFPYPIYPLYLVVNRLFAVKIGTMTLTTQNVNFPIMNIKTKKNKKNIE